MGGEREQRDARSAHAGALWSLMEPYVAIRLRVVVVQAQVVRVVAIARIHIVLLVLAPALWWHRLYRRTSPTDG